jgi:hypothetical protein
MALFDSLAGPRAAILLSRGREVRGQIPWSLVLLLFCFSSSAQ